MLEPPKKLHENFSSSDSNILNLAQGQVYMNIVKNKFKKYKCEDVEKLLLLSRFWLSKIGS